MSMCPHTRRSDPMDLEDAVFRPDSPLRVRCGTQIRLWGFDFDAGSAIAILVLEWPGGGVGQGSNGKYEFIEIPLQPSALRGRNRLEFEMKDPGNRNWFRVRSATIVTELAARNERARR